MNTQPEVHEDDCHLCGGTGEVSISKDGTDKGADYYGCPVCICRERDEEEARLRAANVDCINHFNALKAERDELLVAVCRLLEMPDFDGTKETSKARMATKLNARATIAKVAS